MALTQKEIADHIGVNQQRVSQLMKALGIDWREKSLDEIRLAYIGRLRETAAGFASVDGSYDLNKERALSERVDRELKTLQLAEKKKQLVNVDQLMDVLENVVVAFRQELLARDDKLKMELDTLYGTDIDVTILNDYTHNALNHLSGYLAGYRSRHGETGADYAAPEENGDDGVGGVVPRNEREGHGDAGAV